MAMLEVHDGVGRVHRVSIDRDQTVLFGSSPKCDLILEDPKVLPFHGRLRWRRRRLKVDASPEARFIELNGHKMATASFRQGDEIRVGSCRIFLLNIDEDPSEKPARLRDDKTRVQSPTFLADPVLKPQGDATLVGPMPGPGRGRAFELERDDWLHEIEVAPPSMESAPASVEPHAPRERGRRSGRTRPAKHPRATGRGWARLLRAFTTDDRPPGQERVFSSPSVVGLLVALLILVLLSSLLWRVIRRTTAARLYSHAVANLDDGDYRNAIRRYDDFLAGYPDHPLASKARVLRALANVRQFTSSTGTSWTNALDAGRAMVETVGREPAFRDASTELAELVLKTAEGLADRTRGSADARTLAQAESALALHARIAGKAAESFVMRSRLPRKLAEARAAVRKASIRARALAEMDASLGSGASSGVYAARDSLVGQYPDLADDRALIDRLTAANDLIRRAVTIDPSRRPAEVESRADPFGPPTSLVLRMAPSGTGTGTGSDRPTQPGPVVHALAEGFACGVDGATGAPLWQLPVGHSSPFPPRMIPGGSTLLVVDARSDELLRLDARTGSLIWRQGLGERVSDPPLVLGNQVIQATPGGKLLSIDLASGELRATVNLGMPLARTPIGDEAGEFLYVLADRDCLFVLARDPLACAAVAYLGHAPGSVACPPARLGRFLVVAENHAIGDGRWNVFVIDADGLKVKPVQQVAVPGWTWSTPASSGSVIWAIGDRGGAAAYAVGTYEAKAPFRTIAQTNPEPTASGPAFAIARSEREVWIASGRSSRLDLDPEAGKVAAAWTLGEAGPSLAPPQRAGDLLVLTQQYDEGAGVALWGVEAQSGTVRWRTVLGADWRVGPRSVLGVEGLNTLTEEGRTLTLPGELIAKGGFVEVPLPKPGGARLPVGPLDRLVDGDLTVVVPGTAVDHLLVRSGPGDGEGEGGGEFQRVELPSTTGASPILWGRDLLVPGVDGRVDLIDPTTGTPRAEPFMTPFDRDRPTRWRSPVRIDGDAVVLAEGSGRVRRLSRSSTPAPRLVASAEASLGQDLVANPLSTGGAVILITTDNRIRALAARDLSPVGAWPLEAPLSLSATVAGLGFLADTSGNIHAFGNDGRRLWSGKLRDGPPAGAPVVAGDSVWFLGRDGSLHRHALADGAPLGRQRLDILPAGDLHALGSQIVVPVGLGTLRTLKIGP